MSTRNPSWGQAVAGKVAVVTGATSGIGRGTAVRLAAEGAYVFATGRRAEEGAITVQAMKDAGGDGEFVRQDVAEEADWQALLAHVKASKGRLDILVNNAGAFFIKPIEDTSYEDFDWLYRVNLESAFLGTKHGMAMMAETGGGSIINVSSLMGQVGLENAIAYCATKGAVTLLSKSAALEGAETDVRVNSLHPGVIWTPMLEESMGTDQAVMDFLASETPLKVLGKPEDMAAGILYLASDRASLVTGIELTIDGGRGAD